MMIKDLILTLRCQNEAQPCDEQNHPTAVLRLLFSGRLLRMLSAHVVGTLRFVHPTNQCFALECEFSQPFFR